MEEEESSTPSEDRFLAELAEAPDVVPSSALLGTSLGRYTIEALLGRGGMGVVFRARDTVLDRAVALKLVPPEMLSDPERRARFVREARSAAAASHANIAAVYDVGEIDGQVFLAMELVEGESLRARIRRGPLSVDEALLVSRGVVRGLVKAHEKGIVHRDLKPDNVMVGDAFDVKLLDFGLAKLRDIGSQVRAGNEGTLTYDGRVLGTPAYMSPEQAKGRPVDGRTDLFAFGVLLYEMLVGARPFRGDSAIEILSAVTRDDPPSLPDTVPADLRAIVKRCLEKDPDARYASAKELLGALEGETSTPSGPRALARSSVVSAQPAALVAGSGGGRRPRLRAGLAFLAVGLAVGGGIAITRSPGKTPAPAPPATAALAARDAAAGKAVTDHAKPRSQSPAALAAYASGLQSFRDGSIAFASHELGRAVMLDPGLAAAHLRILLLGSFKMDATTAREHYAAASQHRSDLDERDAALLAASEELIRERPNHKALAQAMAAVAERFRDDAEVSWMAASTMSLAGRLPDARTYARRARELDPSFAAALWHEATALQDDETDTAVRLLDECLRIAPGAASCLRVRSGIRAAKGDCAGFEADARRMTEVEPRGPRAYEYLAAALAARGAPVESVRASLDKRASLGVPGTTEAPPELRAQADLWVALLTGDFGTAESAALALDQLSGGDASEFAHVVPSLTLMDIYVERGEPERALGVGESFVRRLPAWTANSPGGVRARLVALRRQLGKIDEAQAQKERDALMKEADEAWSDPDPRKGVYHWLAIEAQYVSSPSEARHALGRLPQLDGGGLRVHGFDLWPQGKVALLAGKPAQAASTLREALGTCVAMPTTDGPFARVPFSWMEAQLALGEALEETDRDGACEAYGRVIDRWKDAKPRSVSVEKARARARARGCVRS